MSPGPTQAKSWVEKVRTAREAWNLGKRLGFPLIRPGLEFRDPDRWVSESDNLSRIDPEESTSRTKEKSCRTT